MWSNILGAGAGVTIILVIIGFFALLGFMTRFLRHVEPGKAMIITSRKGMKVCFTGAYIFPLIHKVKVMDISTKVMTVTRKGTDGLICKDNIRADISVNFYIRVNRDEESVQRVATTIGCERASAHETLNDLFQAKFSEALKTVGKQMEFADLFTNRATFKQQIVDTIGEDLNGYILEDAAIDYLAQTPLQEMDPNDIMDAEGIKKITDLTSKEAIRTNEIEREKEESVTKRNVEAKERVLELERQQAEAEARKKAEIEIIQAREEAEKDKVTQEERLKAEQARITTSEQIEIAEANRAREVEIANKNKERAIVLETERIEMEKQLEITKRERTVTLAAIEKEKAVEQEKKAIQDIIRQRVAVERAVAEEEERTKDTRAFADADRTKKVAITEAEQAAEENLIKDIKAAEAKERAAVHQAKEKEILSEAEKVTSVKMTEAKEIMAKGIIAEQSAAGLAHVKVMEAEADAVKKKGEAEAEARKMMGLAEAETTEKMGEAEGTALLQKGEAAAKVEEAKAVAVQKRGMAEADARQRMGIAEANSTHQMGEAEAKSMQARYAAEAEGIKEKAESMKLYDEVGREHEEFKLKLAMQEKIAVEEINVKKDIAVAQSEILAAAMKSAHIDIVGGETEFFNNLINATIQGKTKSALIENNSVLTEIKDALLQPGDENLVVKIKRLIDEIGISSETVKNLTLSAMLAQLSQSTERPELLQKINNLKTVVDKYGLSDLALSLEGKRV